MNFFLRQAYDDFGTEDTDFFAVYDKVFVQIAELEALADSGTGRAPNYDNPPSLGGPDTERDEWNQFYKFWAGFVSR